MIVLGIETSCDETAAAIVRDDRAILANVVLSQLDEHRPYGGVVPEIAARAHLDYLDGIVARAMKDAGLDYAALDGIAVTGGPGLIGGVMVGVMTAKAIALAHAKPFIAVNHLEGHALTARLTDGLDFPYLLLLVSGGHCQLLIAEDVGRYRRLGGTIDDAVGEAFDKSAKLLELGYPGGPALEAAAIGGDAARFALPRPLRGRPGCDFSFSGLKTAIRHTVDALPPGPLDARDVADVAASFQAAVGDVLVDRSVNAFAAFRAAHPATAPALVVAGGVAANRALRQQLADLCAREGARLIAPPLGLCTDNAAMIAWAGLEHLRRGETDGLDFAPRPRWPLDTPAAGAAYPRFPFAPAYPSAVNRMAMTDAPKATAKIDLRSLFPTPVAVVQLPGFAEVNARLRASILEYEAATPSNDHSNLGGWQSSWDLGAWGGEAAEFVLAFARQLANRLTADRYGQPAGVEWRMNAWANINRGGHGNEFHTHPGCYWSGTYYVDDGGIGADPSLGGEFEIHDPRGIAPAMYRPDLAPAAPGCLSVGASEVISPAAGNMVMFPSWLSHAVRPYTGGGTRISIAFNLS